MRSLPGINGAFDIGLYEVHRRLIQARDWRVAIRQLGGTSKWPDGLGEINLIELQDVSVVRPKLPRPEPPGRTAPSFRGLRDHPAKPHVGLWVSVCRDAAGR
jgi:hypothetical protein